jgi:hypothetical protein
MHQTARVVISQPLERLQPLRTASRVAKSGLAALFPQYHSGQLVHDRFRAVLRRDRYRSSDIGPAAGQPHHSSHRPRARRMVSDRWSWPSPSTQMGVAPRGSLLRFHVPIAVSGRVHADQRRHLPLLVAPGGIFRRARAPRSIACSEALRESRRMITPRRRARGRPRRREGNGSSAGRSTLISAPISAMPFRASRPGRG